MGVAERIGGLPSLAAVLVVATGILGAVAGPALLRRLGFTDVRVIGLALGTASHGIGTARAFQDGPQCGSFAGLAMAVNGAASALLIPLAFSLGALP
jgi:putative effector of murein hydrolase